LWLDLSLESQLLQVAEPQPTPFPRLGQVVAVAAGKYHSVALKADGTVVAWGLNHVGQTNIPAGLGGVVAIAAGGYHTLALKSDGSVVAWGWNEQGQSTVPATLANVVAVGAGSAHSIALRADGTVVGWGSNAQGELTLPSQTSAVTALAVAVYCASLFSLRLILKLRPPVMPLRCASSMEVA
jgi:alpha-tubulin suppressor-like RCC1 family protein